MKILVTIPFNETQKEKIRSAADGNELLFMNGSEVTENIVEDVDIIMGNLPVTLIKAAGNLKWFQLNKHYQKQSVWNTKMFSRKRKITLFLFNFFFKRFPFYFFGSIFHL